MRNIIVTEFISLDGVVEAPGGEEGYRHSGWTFDIEPDPAVYEFKSQELADIDALLLGRRTYEGFAGAWPERKGEFADKFNSMKKYVVSSTLRDPEWNNTDVIGSTTSPPSVTARVGRSRSPAALRSSRACTAPAWSTSGT